ncbi:hypothetical protein KQX54_015238 [Cotesia glomerata]|uniref:Uncharacterized protein n=1 Tax=Cotesia glomerata TaxID=32391 RepID=A0AAV7IS10_COTGL|nr:hypothetical protein KQX54_015238 [Cotesia glomerata]
MLDAGCWMFDGGFRFTCRLTATRDTKPPSMQCAVIYGNTEIEEYEKAFSKATTGSLVSAHIHPTITPIVMPLVSDSSRLVLNFSSSLREIRFKGEDYFLAPLYYIWPLLLFEEREDGKEIKRMKDEIYIVERKIDSCVLLSLLSEIKSKKLSLVEKELNGRMKPNTRL